MRRIIVNEKSFLKLGLFHCEIRTCVLQFLRERNGIFAGDSGEVLPQIGGEVQRDLLCQIRILFAEIVDAHHRIIDEMRTHLQHHDAGTLERDFLLLVQILFQLVKEDNAKHR